MGAYSVLECIRKFKPKGDMVKVINGNKYYVYEYKSIRDENGDLSIPSKFLCEWAEIKDEEIRNKQ